MRTGRPIKYKFTVEDIRSLQAKGMTQAEIAQHYGCTRVLVTRKLTKHRNEQMASA